MNKLQEISDDLGSFAVVMHTPTYPQLDDFIQIVVNKIPFVITTGLDTFHYGPKSCPSKRKDWYITKTDNEYPDLYIEKGFKTYREAIKGLFKAYREELDNNQKCLDLSMEDLI